MIRKQDSTFVFIDPVCLRRITPGQTAKNFTYKMRTYYFCSPACRSVFQADPEIYLSPDTSMKTVWQTCLKRCTPWFKGKEKS
ncbi:MAG: YHS domain-containing protein [Desulfohalobiaceae bacterium]|nr:YHS domain-containing protein [Desulfohalobiaceae bacterium]